MLYISSVTYSAYTISDSDTGESFDVVLIGGDFFRCNMLYCMDNILGYIDTYHACAVSKYLLILLEYIDSIEYCIGDTENALFISVARIYAVSDNNIIARPSVMRRTYTVLDMVMCASLHDGFYEMMETGVLKVCFGRGRGCSFTIKFCGSYKSAVAKLIMLYRGSEEFQKKLDGVYLM